MGIEGRARQNVCTITKRDNRELTGFPRGAPENFNEKLTKLRERGWVVKVHTGSDYQPRRMLEINGHTLRLQINAQTSPWVPKRAIGGYYKFGVQHRENAFVLLHITTLNDTYIVPTSWLAGGGAVYVPYGRIEGYKGQPQRDWGQWLEAWEQLGP